MKNYLVTIRYSNGEEIKYATLQWQNQIGRNFLDTGNEKLMSRYNKCPNKLGDYIEK